MTAYISAARWDCINRSDPARGTRKRNPPFSWSMKIGASGWQPMSACIQGLAAGYRVTFCDESSGGSSAISALGAVRCTTGVIANKAQNRSFCARAGCRAGPASSVRSSLAVDFVHPPAAAGVHRSRPGIGWANAARRAGAWKGPAKYWVSCVARSSVIIWASLVAQVARRARRISQREHCAGGRRAVSGGGSRR